jgi:dienelactone hydrolase
MSPSPSPAPTFDLARIGSPGPAPSISVVGEQTISGVAIKDVTLARPDGTASEAYLVEPAEATAAPHPAILWFHWLEGGSPTSNRTEFLEEARGLAARGVVSLLVQGTFPWNERPTSIEHDMAAVEDDVRMLRSGLDLLTARADVDPDRVALVGHDFGGMYSSVVFGSDARAKALVMMAPTARWGDWFLRYWSIPDPESDYLAAMEPLDPVTWLARAVGRPILLQFASDDQYVPADVAAEIASAAGPGADARTYATDHEMDEATRADRDAWLARQLGLE